MKKNYTAEKITKKVSKESTPNNKPVPMKKSGEKGAKFKE